MIDIEIDIDGIDEKYFISRLNCDIKNIQLPNFFPSIF